MKLLITGSTGMVGQCLLNTLSRNDRHAILAPDRRALNLLDQHAVCAYLQKHQPDLAIHLAAKVGGIQANIDAPIAFLVENTLMNTHVIMAACHAGVKKLLNMGSACMYPKDYPLLRETDLMTGALEPTNASYALAKLNATQLCQNISKEYGYHYKTLIPTNLYGPHDHFSLTRSHLIPAAIAKIHHAHIENHPQVSIWGDGQARREFLFVQDFVDFLMFAIDHMAQLPDWLNVGLGQDYSVQTYYEVIKKVIGYAGDFTFDLSKPVGMHKKQLDISQAQKLGWSAKTSLEAGIAKTYTHYLENHATTQVF